MPIKKSAKKALKRSVVLRERNDFFRSAMKAAVKSLKKNITMLDKENTKEQVNVVNDMLVKAYATIDKAKQRNILHKNTAARKKSRLTMLVNKIINKAA